MINKWIGIGNLTNDVELRYTGNGTPVASFSVACNEKYKDQKGDVKESVEYIKIVAWQRLAEICGEYLSKGSRVYIEGKITTRKWQDKNGSDRYTTEIIAREMKMLSSRESSGGQGGGYNRPSDGHNVGDDVPF